MKLSRLRANEVNIYCRGGVNGVKHHVSQLRLSHNNSGVGGQSKQKLSLIDSVMGNQGSYKIINSTENEALSFVKPPIDLDLLT